MQSIAEHALHDITDKPARRRRCQLPATTRTTRDGGVVNASAYRAFLLTSARAAVRRATTTAQPPSAISTSCWSAQKPDGSWYYAVDGVRDFVDHFHTCFVLKALAKIDALDGRRRAAARAIDGRRATTT